MGHLEVHAHLKIRPGHPEGFKAQAAEIIRLTREKDTQTIRYDWFINEDGTECEVHETYLSGRGSIEHNTHVMEGVGGPLREVRVRPPDGAFGEVSQSLRELANKHAGGIAVYSFLQGLEPQRLFRARSKGRFGRSPAILVLVRRVSCPDFHSTQASTSPTVHDWHPPCDACESPSSQSPSSRTSTA